MDDPKPVFSYSATQVFLSVWGVPPPGPGFDCQGGKATTMDVELDEPLGDRTVVGGATPAVVFPAVTTAAP